MRSRSILGRLRERFGTRLDATLADVEVVIDKDGQWIRERRGRWGENGRALADCNLEMLGGFSPLSSIDELAVFVGELDGATLLNLTDIFGPADAYLVAAEEGLMEADVRAVVIDLLRDLSSASPSVVIATLRRLAMIASDLGPAEQRILIPPLLERARTPRLRPRDLHGSEDLDAVRDALADFLPSRLENLRVSERAG